MATTSARRDLGCLELAVLLLQVGKRRVAAVSRVHVKHAESVAGHDPDIRAGPPSPPLANRWLVARGLVLPFFADARVLPRRVAAAARATPVLADLMQWQDAPTFAGLRQGGAGEGAHRNPAPPILPA